ncbi:hypothetical protein Patl1_27143 [Pistacia atlantica]|uniref:Uncharacterized protein n=1 Tax=Pistacia atlantica TaxID=434234 RepID=A0ACC1AYR6_9ROSI|nr:hypothetical protein Patl1_27143 [Pistacia atlantica]
MCLFRSPLLLKISAGSSLDSDVIRRPDYENKEGCEREIGAVQEGSAKGSENLSCVEEGSMVNGAGRTLQAGHSPPFVSCPVMGSDDGRNSRSRSLPSRCEGLSNGMVHSIVSGFERGQPLIVDDGRVSPAVRW